VVVPPLGAGVSTTVPTRFAPIEPIVKSERGVPLVEPTLKSRTRVFAVGKLANVPPGALELLKPETDPAAKFWAAGVPETVPVGVVTYRSPAEPVALMNRRPMFPVVGAVKDSGYTATLFVP
jgi:hypothetical protein